MPDITFTSDYIANLISEAKKCYGTKSNSYAVKVKLGTCTDELREELIELEELILYVEGFDLTETDHSNLQIVRDRILYICTISRTDLYANVTGAPIYLQIGGLNLLELGNTYILTESSLLGKKITELGAAPTPLLDTDIFTLVRGDQNYRATLLNLESYVADAIGSTLDDAYDGDGSGAGRQITADSGAVEITVPDTGNNLALVLNQNDTTNNPRTMSIINTGSGDELLVQRTDAGVSGPCIDIFHDTSSPTVGDRVGHINFQGRNDANALVTYGQVRTFTSDITDGSEEAKMDFYVMDNGDLNVLLEVDADINGIRVGAGSNPGLVAGNSDEDLILQAGDVDLGQITVPGGLDSNIILDPNGAGGVELEDCSLIIGENEGIEDVNNNRWLTFQQVTNAVNGFEMTHAITANPPQFAVIGSDTNIDMQLVAKGTGSIFTNSTVGIGTSSPSAKLEISNTGTDVELVLTRINVGTLGPELNFFHDTSSPSSNDLIGRINFIGKNAASEDINFGQIRTIIVNVADGTETGYMDFYLMDSGTLRTILEINPTQNGIVVGDGTADGVVESGGIYDLVLQTAHTFTSQMTVGAGSNSDITIAPHGTGKILLGNGSEDVTVQTVNARDLIIGTGSTPTSQITIDSGTDGDITLTPDGSGEVFILNTDDDEVPSLRLFNNSTIAVNDIAGEVLFEGNSDGALAPTYGRIYALATNVGDGTQSGALIFSVYENGTPYTFLRSDADGNGIQVGNTSSTDSVVESIGSNNLILRSTSGTTSQVTIGGSTDSDITIAPHGTGELIISSTDGGTTGPYVRLYHDSPTPADGDTVGVINFAGNNDDDTSVNYGQIRCFASDVSDTSEDAYFRFYVQEDSTITNMLDIDPSINGIIVGNSSIASAAIVESEVGTAMQIQTGSNNTGTITIAAGSNGNITIAPHGSGNLFLTECSIDYSDGIKQIFNPNGTNAGINVGSHTADPSTLANGDMWYNSTDNTLSAYINGAVVDFGSGSGAGNTLDSAYDQGGGGSGRTITADSGPVHITVPDTSNNIGLLVTQNDSTNNAVAVEITNSGTGSDLLIRNTEELSSPEIKIYGDSTTPGDNDTVGIITFAGNNFGNNEYTYCQLRGVSTDVTVATEDARFDVFLSDSGTVNRMFYVDSVINGISVGDVNAAGVVQSSGNQDLILQTGNETTGNITLTDGADGDITVAPNGSGDLVLSSANFQISDAQGVVDGNGNELLIFQETALALNYIEITNAINNGMPTVAAAGDQANIDLNLSGKGNGDVHITGNILLDDTLDQHILLGPGNGFADSNGTPIFTLTNINASDVNYFGFEASSTGIGPIIHAQGSDSSVDMQIQPKGGGSILIGTGSASGTLSSNGDYDLILKTGNSTTGTITITDGANGNITIAPNGTGDVIVSTGFIRIASGEGLADSSGNEILTASPSTTPVNNFHITTADTGNGPTLHVFGDDTNINMRLAPKGTGDIELVTGSILYADGETQTFNPNGTSAGVNVGAHTADPSSLNNGDLWYNSTDNTLSARINGNTVDLGVGSQTPWNSDIDANGFSLQFDDNSGIEDSNGNEQLAFQLVASAVNYLEITNAATGNNPSFSAAGDDTNVSITLTPKGTGNVILTTGTITYADNETQTFNPGATSAGLNVGAHTADPSSLTNGDIWYNSTDNTLSARINGATIDLGGGGSQTPWTADVDAAGFSLQFDDATGIEDSNGNEQLIFQLVASAVNYLEITNAATGDDPVLAAVGSDTNINLELSPKGTGDVFLTSGVIVYADGETQIFNPSGATAGLNVGSHTADPSSLNNGDIWYNSTDNTLSARVNGATIDLGPTGGGNDLDAAYDQGGAGQGRKITADNGPVAITATTLGGANLLETILTSTGAASLSTNDIAVIESSRTFESGTAVDNYNVLSVKRSNIAKGGNMTANGTVALFENVYDLDSGTLTDNVRILDLVQSSQASGDFLRLYIQGEANYRFRVDSDGSITMGNGTLADVVMARLGAGIMSWNMTGAIRPPEGTTAQRPGNDLGLIRVNTNTSYLEWNTGSAWESLASFIEYDTFWIDADEMIPVSSASTIKETNEFATNDIMIVSHLFAGGSGSDKVQFKTSMPENWDGENIKVKFYWDAAVGASAADVVAWTVAAGVYSDDDPIDTALGTAVTVTDALIALGDVHISAASESVNIAGTPAADDIIVFEFTRNADDLADNMTENAKLMGVKVQYALDNAKNTVW